MRKPRGRWIPLKEPRGHKWRALYNMYRGLKSHMKNLEWVIKDPFEELIFKNHIENLGWSMEDLYMTHREFRSHIEDLIEGPQGRPVWRIQWRRLLSDWSFEIVQNLNRRSMYTIIYNLTLRMLCGGNQ